MLLKVSIKTDSYRKHCKPGGSGANFLKNCQSRFFTTWQYCSKMKVEKITLFRKTKTNLNYFQKMYIRKVVKIFSKYKRHDTK